MYDIPRISSGYLLDGCASWARFWSRLRHLQLLPIRILRKIIINLLSCCFILWSEEGAIGYGDFVRNRVSLWELSWRFLPFLFATLSGRRTANKREKKAANLSSGRGMEHFVVVSRTRYRPGGTEMRQWPKIRRCSFVLRLTLPPKYQRSSGKTEMSLDQVDVTRWNFFHRQVV